MLAEVLLFAALLTVTPEQAVDDGVIVRPVPSPLQDERDSFRVRSWAATVKPAAIWRASCLDEAVEITIQPGESGWSWSLSRAGVSYPADVAAVFDAEFRGVSAAPAVRTITCDPDALGVTLQAIRPHRLAGYDAVDAERKRTVYEILEIVIWIEDGHASVRQRLHLGDEAIGPADLQAE